MKTIRITGRGSLRVAPDKTRIHIALNDVCEEYAQALEKAARERQTLQGVIREFGFAENDLKTLNGAMIYLNELKIELLWNSSNEAYKKLKDLVSRKFES